MEDGVVSSFEERKAKGRLGERYVRYWLMSSCIGLDPIGRDSFRYESVENGWVKPDFYARADVAQPGFPSYVEVKTTWTTKTAIPIKDEHARSYLAVEAADRMIVNVAVVAPKQRRVFWGRFGDAYSQGRLHLVRLDTYPMNLHRWNLICIDSGMHEHCEGTGYYRALSLATTLARIFGGGFERLPAKHLLALLFNVFCRRANRCFYECVCEEPLTHEVAESAINTFAPWVDDDLVIEWMRLEQRDSVTAAQLLAGGGDR